MARTHDFGPVMPAKAGIQSDKMRLAPSGFPIARCAGVGNDMARLAHV
jgi:hypothetical protein